MPFKKLGNLLNKGASSSSETTKGKGHDGGLYRPLNAEKREIRLAVIEPGKGDETIQCTLKTRAVKSMLGTPYETISYVCGDSSTRATVTVNKQAVEIPANAERVLRKFRSPMSKRPLWIDALCINQVDVEEKSIQVGLMYDIYLGGVRNLIWLGEGDETTARAVTVMKKLAEEMTEEWNIRTDHGYVLSDEKEARWGFKSNISHADVTALERYYASDWFQRLWAVQEAALPQLSWCHRGEHYCTLLTLIRAAKWLQHKAAYLPAGIPPAGTESGVRLYKACDPSYPDVVKLGSLGFRRLLNDTQDLETSEARDRIFAVQGLVMRSSAQEISVFNSAGMERYTYLIHTDYHKPVTKVFSDAALYCILEGKTLSILHSVESYRGDNAISALPSWVPNWGQKSNTDINPPGLLPGFRASGKDQEFNTRGLHEIRENELNVTGFMFSEIECRSNRIAGETLEATFRSDIAETVSTLLAKAGEDANSIRSRYKNGLSMTLTAGESHDNKRWKEGECENLASAFIRVAANGGAPLLNDINDMSTNDERLAARFRQAMIKATRNRCIFTTESGKLGLGPAAMERGDLVCVLYGCSVPVVLRRVFADKRHFHFLGCCYICSYMDGEMVEEHRKAGESDREFVLV